jgi:coenzyme F420-reducing hydrogenase alpha subunit
MTTKTIKVGYLARVEGEAAFRVVVRNGRVQQAELTIFEPPRFFEAFLRGRSYSEVPDLVARICGICPVAYQMSSAHAIEYALGIEVARPLRELRRLLYCGEWISSHALHIFLLHAPDFLGYDSSIHMARDHPKRIEQALELKKIGNEVLALLGGREIHPINVRIGGFFRTPTRRELEPLAERLKWAREIALETVRWVSGFDFPEAERSYTFVALRHPDEYPLNEGRIVSSDGLDIAPAEFETHFEEMQVKRSTALQARLHGGSYLVGPLARYNLNFDKLSPLAQDAARGAGMAPTCTNPYRSIVARAVEVVYACDEALRIIDAYRQPDLPAVAAEPRSGTAAWATEAPRGLLYHRYRLDESGTVVEARIVPPTSQNQACIEEDLASAVGAWVSLSDEALRQRCEQTVRNYDPCISCATHFLRLDVERS